MRPPQENPFRVDRVSALPFVGRNVVGLMHRFERLHYHAAILGEEGAGKSTLMRAIGGRLVESGIAMVNVALPGSATRSQRRDGVIACLNAPAGAVVLFDGFEQLGYWSRRAARRRQRLLVTIHRPAGLPVLARVRPGEKTVRRLLRLLLADVSADTQAFAFARFAEHHGDVRATLFDLYDAWADGRIPESGCSATSPAAISAAEPNRGETDYGAHAHHS